MRAIYPGDLSLSEVLSRLGFAHRAGGFNSRDILDAKGVVVFRGSAGDTWEWLRKTGKVRR